MKFIKNTLVTFSVQITATVLTIVATITIARVLGPSGKGAYSLTILVPTLLFLLGTLGIQIANTYFVGSKKYKATDLASNSLVSALGLGIILAVGFLTYFHFYHPSFLRDIDPLHLVIAVSVLPFHLLSSYFAYLLLGEQKVNQYNLVHAFPSSVLLVLVLVLLLGFKTGLLGAILSWAAAMFMSGLLSILLVRKLTSIRWSFHPKLFKESVGFGIKGYLGNIVQFLNFRLDMLLVAFFMNVAFVGYYSIAVAMAEALWLFPSAVAVVVFGRTPGLSAEEANISSPRVCRNTLFIITLAAVALFFLARYIIAILFGSAFLPALQPFWILLPGIVALGASRAVGSDIAGRGKPIIMLVPAAISLAVNIPLNLLLIPRWGIAGAAFASTISYIIAAIVVIVIFLRISKNSWVDTLILKRQDLKIYTGLIAKVRSLNSAIW